jgi:hypothetical protein
MEAFIEVIFSRYNKAEIAAMLAELMDSFGLDESDLEDLLRRTLI